MYFGETIRELRIKKGMTQYELAELAGISRSYLAHIELNNKKGTLTALKKITEALGMSFVVEISDEEKACVDS